MSGGKAKRSQRGAPGQPRMAPSIVPIVNASSVVVNSNPIVHGSASASMLVTVRG